MKSFMDGVLIPMIPHLIEEVPDLKGLIDSCIYKKRGCIQRTHCISQQFKYYMNANGWPLM
jgi:hypothetical protein